MSAGLLSFLIAAAFGLVFLPFLIGYNYYFRIWWKTNQAGAPIPFTQLLAMTARRIDARRVSSAYIQARKRGIAVTIDQLAAHAQAGGNVNRVVAMLEESQELGGDLTFARACDYDLGEHGIIAFPAGQP